MPGVQGMQARAKALGDVLRYVLPSTLLACALTVLPALLHGATLFWLWGVTAAVLGSAAAVARPHGHHCPPRHVWQGWWPCALAAGAGVTLDFVALPPHIMLSMCPSTGGINFGLAALLAHIRLLPATSTAMLLVIGFTQVRTHVGRRTQAGWVRAVPAIAFEFAAMSASMVLCVEVLRAMAAGANLPWTADGMCAGMMGGTLLWPILTRVRTAGTSLLKEKWLYGKAAP